jgi:hypothetical protein
MRIIYLLLIDQPIYDPRIRSNSQAEMPDIFNPTAYQKSYSPKSPSPSKLLKEHHQLRSLIHDQQSPSKQCTEDVKFFYGKKGRDNNDARIRIRGKISYIVETQEGSLVQNIYEQKEEGKRKQHVKEARK